MLTTRPATMRGSLIALAKRSSLCKSDRGKVSLFRGINQPAGFLR